MEKVAARSSGDPHALFTAAWNAVPYRYRAAWEYEARYAASVGRQAAPEPEQRFEQDHDLFGFAMAAVSSVECYYFAIHCVGAIVDPVGFPLTADEDLKFKPGRVSKRFDMSFPGDALSLALQKFLASPEFQSIGAFRIELFHRGTPPRRHPLGSQGPEPSTMPANPLSLASRWSFTLVLDANVTAPLRRWLMTTMDTLLKEARAFAEHRL